MDLLKILSHQGLAYRRTIFIRREKQPSKGCRQSPSARWQAGSKATIRRSASRETHDNRSPIVPSSNSSNELRGYVGQVRNAGPSSSLLVKKPVTASQWAWSWQDGQKR